MITFEITIDDSTVLHFFAMFIKNMKKRKKKKKKVKIVDQSNNDREKKWRTLKAWRFRSSIWKRDEKGKEGKGRWCMRMTSEAGRRTAVGEQAKGCIDLEPQQPSATPGSPRLSRAPTQSKRRNRLEEMREMEERKLSSIKQHVDKFDEIQSIKPNPNRSKIPSFDIKFVLFRSI